MESNEMIVRAIKENCADDNSLLHLYNNNRGLINLIINKHISNKSEREDLEQDAYIVLCDAVANYEIDSEYNFATFYANQLHWYYCRNKQSDAYIPKYMSERIVRLKKLEEEYKRNNLELTDKTIMRKMNITQKELDSVRIATDQVRYISIYTPQDETGELLLLDVIADERNQYQTIDDSIASEQIKKELWEIVDNVNDSEILHEHFENKKALTEIAEEYGKTYSNIAERYKRILRYLRIHDRKNRLRSLAYDSGIYSQGIKGSINTFRRTNTSSTEKIALNILEYSTY